MTTKRLVFTRIGRDHNPPTLTIEISTEPENQLARVPEPQYQIAQAAWELVMGHRAGDDGSRHKRVASQDVETSYDPDGNRGFITCGFHSGGDFTVEPVTD